MRVIKVIKNQSLLDIALQEYGSVNGAFWLVEDNDKLLGITDNVFENDELNIRDEVINEKMKNYLAPHDLATVKDSRATGIGYWRIEKTFKVNSLAKVEVSSVEPLSITISSNSIFLSLHCSIIELRQPFM